MGSSANIEPDGNRSEGISNGSGAGLGREFPSRDTWLLNWRTCDRNCHKSDSNRDTRDSTDDAKAGATEIAIAIANTIPHPHRCSRRPFTRLCVETSANAS